MEAFALQSSELAALLRRSGVRVSGLVLCGGLADNGVYVQAHADALGLPVRLPACRETVALGAASLAVDCVRPWSDLPSSVVHPRPEAEAHFQRKRQVFPLIQTLMQDIYAV